MAATTKLKLECLGGEDGHEDASREKLTSGVWKMVSSSVWAHAGIVTLLLTIISSVYSPHATSTQLVVACSTYRTLLVLLVARPGLTLY